MPPMLYGRVMPDFVKAVQQESDEVAAELQKILADMEPLLQERRRLEQRAKALETVISTYQAGQGGNAAGALTAARAHGRHFLDDAYDILDKEGALYYERLLTRLQETGVTIPGRNPGANLIAHMSRDARFKRTGRGTYAVNTSP
jgi:hypothetical protein